MFIGCLVLVGDQYEIAICTDIDSAAGTFTYLLGRGIDVEEDLACAKPDMAVVDIPGGLYAVFSTPKVAEDQYIQSIRDTWSAILTEWLPGGEFEFDEGRAAFEYYDHRDHGWYFGGKVQMDIFIPIRQKEAEIEKSRARGRN